MYSPTKIERFNENILYKYQIYNSIFMTLPFDSVGNTGVLLPLFAEICANGYKNGNNPIEIFNQFADKFLNSISETEKIDLMFLFIQYVERQIVLFDAIEDAGFAIINNMDGIGSLRDVKEKAESENKIEDLKHFLNNFNVRTVLTAHPTQFYPGSVLGIITDLTASIREDNLQNIKKLLAQLGKTPFFKKEKPTPFDEAVSLVWYLENVFYQTAGDIIQYLNNNILMDYQSKNALINFGFWPGGDRDGNPFVNSEITLKVANRLRTSILRCYYNEIRILKRKLTFYNIDVLITKIEVKLYQSVFYSNGEIFISLSEFKEKLNEIRDLIINKHQSLYLFELDSLIAKVNLFGFYFATLDIRQNSKIHNEVLQCVSLNSTLFPFNYNNLPDVDKIKLLSNVSGIISLDDFEDSITKSTIESIYAMKTIQERNGVFGANRYIISNNESALNVLEILTLIKLCDWENPTVDIIPLFEVIDDLQNADKIMEQLYNNSMYKKHLISRNNKQTIMLGFSDGTKDGGYLMANWSIYKAKESITKVSRKHGVKVIFFDGRGGPPARGGGKTHKFYASLGSNIENQEIQVTVQGQTISSNFGTLDSCRFNLENLLSAGIQNEVFNKTENLLSENDKNLLDELSQKGYEKYLNFKNHPKFVPYLEKMSTLKYFEKSNIGSRPAKRNSGNEFNFNDLRAIPFVSSWSQLKQNVPGFFGVGTALKYFEDENKWNKIQELYNNSLFFKTLLENSMMSLTKTFFPLTSYMKNDLEFGAFWQIIYDEFELSKKMLLKIANHKQLMENYPDGRASIALREQIVIPLLTIQQYALLRIKQLENDNVTNVNLIENYQKIVTRSLFGNTNASRNSA
ncbi:MAG: phosphoenolpyruvate carboxylase [Flavobacterium sp.]|nr:phosphoenolpyruvate carboxylase [Flavobacterium sp.]